MSVRDRTAADLPRLVDMLRRVHEADGYPTVWPGDAIGWLTGAAPAAPGLPIRTARWQATSACPGRAHSPRRRYEPEPPSDPVSSLRKSPGCSARLKPAAPGSGQLLRRAADAAHRLGLWPVLEVRHDGRPGASRLYDAAGWHLVGTVPRRFTTEIVLPFDCWIGPEPGGGLPSAIGLRDAR